MTRLVLLNGPPGCGKSTIAQLYVAGHPGALNLDIDRIRREIDGWQDDPERSGLLAREIAVERAVAYLQRGRDVVVPQYLGRVELIERLEHTAAATGAEFREVVLMTAREVAVRRFDERTRAASHPMHVEAGLMAVREGGPDPVGAMYDRLQLLLAGRPSAVLVPIGDDDPAATYRRVLQVLGE